ncbi:MAG: hypothetical protein DI539_25450 [Flavobacterium psychrophilum]|nr:MAG: hypothetical protein DI539_25450 [Flavobacterium psychrophilum]
MRKQLIYLAIALLFFNCNKKSDFNDLAGPQVLKGVVVIYDNLSGMQNLLPGKNHKVYIRYSGKSNDEFLYSTNADAAGQFYFNGIDPDQSYTIYAMADTNGVKYYGENNYTTGNYVDKQADTLKLLPSTTNQNGIHLVVTAGNQEPVPNVTAWAFNNKALFDADTSAGRVFDIPVNGYGVGNKLNIPAGLYYLRVKTRIGSKDLAGENVVKVDPKGIAQANIALSTTPLPTRNGIEATIWDAAATPVAGAKVYAYRSKVIFLSDTVDYSNSLFTMTSNAAGLAAAYVIDPGTYYLRAVRIVNSDKFIDVKENVVVTAGAITPVAMTVVKK